MKKSLLLVTSGSISRSESEKEAAKQKISGIEEVKSDKVVGEFAFITSPLTEAEFEELTGDLSVKNKIIINF